MGSGFWVIFWVTVLSFIAGTAGYFSRTTNANPLRLVPTRMDIKDKDGVVTTKVIAMGVLCSLVVSFTAGWFGYFSAQVLAKQAVVGSYTNDDGKIVEQSQLYLNGTLIAALMLAAFQGANYLQKRIEDSSQALIEKKQADNTVVKTTGLTRSGQSVERDDVGFLNATDDPVMVVSQETVTVPLDITVY